MVILLQFDVLLPRYGRKRCFSGFETGFTSFSVNYWALWWLFCVNLTYCCKDTGKNFASSTLKPVLRHLLFFFKHFGGYFWSIWCTVAKIQANTLFGQLSTWIYGICRSYFGTFVVIFINRTYPCKGKGKIVASSALKPVWQHSPFLFGYFSGYIVSI